MCCSGNFEPFGQLNLNYPVAAGCFTFARTDWNGTLRSADDIHAMSLANPDSEYCTVTSADRLLNAPA